MFRSRSSHEAYKQRRSEPQWNKHCPLCAKEILHTFTYWHIIPNSYPYDNIAEVHHMLIPKRHTVESRLTPNELQELVSIKESHIHTVYEYIMEATHSCKSVPNHFHLHLIVEKDKYSD